MNGNKNMKFVLTHEKIVKIVVFLILFCTYILPTAEISAENIYGPPKAIFVAGIFIMYILTFKKCSLKELLFGILVVFMTIYTKEINYLMFITIMFLDKLIEYKDYIKKYLKKSNILYICLIFTLLYSALYFGQNNRYAHTSIKEINQSGLAIFCLGVLLFQKNRKIAVFTLAFGCLTLSRSYLLAIVCMLIFKTSFAKKIFTEKIISKLNYTNLTIISSIGLFLLGIFYIMQYKMGNIVFGSNEVNRLFTLLDLSNFFRFSAVIIVVLCFKNNLSKLLTGITDAEYIEFGQATANELGIIYRVTVPHNLFFSHLKIYGIFAVFEIMYTSSILKKITNSNNFGIYIGIALYSILLGAGFYSYWLYLSVFVLITNMGEVELNEKEKLNNC